MTLKKIAIVGPESSGKTFLAEKLSVHYRCLWVPEYAREYLEKFTHPYTQEDVEQIAKGQIAAEDTAAKKSTSLLVVDTDLLVIKIWMEHKYGSTPAWIEREIAQRKYHLHLLAAPDIPYEFDVLRENPELGAYFFKLYEQLLIALKFPYKIVSGSERLNTAIKAIDSL